MTNLNHQYAIRRVDMDFSCMPEPLFSRHKQYCHPQRPGVNCFTFGEVHATVNDGRFTASSVLTMIAASENSGFDVFKEAVMKRAMASMAVVAGGAAMALYGLVARLACGDKLYCVFPVSTIAPFGPFVSKNHS